MNIYAIADLHLSFDGAKPMDIYGGQWIDHTVRLEKNWRSMVSEEDVVILAGDLSWSLKQEGAIDDLNWISALPGKKVLIKGNHDLWWTSANKLNRLYDNMYFLQNTYYKAGDYAICGSRGWICPGDIEFTTHDRKIYQRELVRLRMSLEEAKKAGETHIIGAIHFPPANEGLEDSGFTDLFEEFGVELVVYGHLHGTDAHLKGLKGIRNGVEYRLVACDYLSCRPLRLIPGFCKGVAR
ncbi:MAG: metallophosphoesterase [Eubacteriales bacterium]|nr:metallophosphoesterase [Eubacteriales bacterium]